jgi:UDP-GlcNAc:undecaprenyl-phosphate GlcNAc-1-phosphate transferase
VFSAGIAFVMAFLSTGLVTPRVRRFALLRGVVDTPGGRRVHQKITPRLGGAAVFVGFFAALALLAMADTSAFRFFRADPGKIVGLVAGGLVVVGVGAVDDVRGVGAWRKLAAQVVAALLAYHFGYRIDAISLPWLGSIELGIFAVPVTVAWFLGIINAINLIDGLDGLAAGIAFVACVSNFALANMNAAPVVAILSASLGGALLGFLRYNFNPASIFMGDSGSMFIGFVLAATSLAGAMTKSSTAVAVLVPMIALGVPIFDTMLAMIRRTLARRPIFSADRGHIHHRLLDMGLTQQRVVLMLYGMSGALAIAAIGIAVGRSWPAGISIALVGGILFVFVRMVAPLRTTAARRMAPERAPRLEELRDTVHQVVASLVRARSHAEVRDALAMALENPLVGEVGLQADDAGHLAPLEESVGSGFLAFDLASEPRTVLAIRVSSTLQPLDSGVRGVLVELADACEAALRRLEARSSAVAPPPQSAHASRVVS